jgi:hypothetical protein
MILCEEETLTGCCDVMQGVVTSVLSLMQGIVNDYSDEYEDSVPKAVDRLRGVCRGGGVAARSTSDRRTIRSPQCPRSPHGLPEPSSSTPNLPAAAHSRSIHQNRYTESRAAHRSLNLDPQHGTPSPARCGPQPIRILKP